MEKQHNTYEYSLRYTKKIMEKVSEILDSQEKTISDLAEALNLHRSTIHRYKNGERVLSAYRVMLISEFFKVDASSLLPNTYDEVEKD